MKLLIFIALICVFCFVVRDLNIFHLFIISLYPSTPEVGTYFFVFLLIFISNLVSTGQTIKINGSVIDEKNVPIPFAHLIVDGSNIKIASNHKGEFSLDNLVSPFSVKVSAIGYSSLIKT